MLNWIYLIDTDLMIVVATDDRREVFYPILDYEDIGKGGDFTKPFTFTVEHMSRPDLTRPAFISRNLVPLRVKNWYRRYYPYLMQGEKIKVKREVISAIWTPEDLALHSKGLPRYVKQGKFYSGWDRGLQKQGEQYQNLLKTILPGVFVGDSDVATVLG